MSVKPEDISESAWREACEAFNAPFDPSALTANATIAITARAIDAATARERERCALIAEEIGKSYGEDETGWLDCSETIAAAIRKGLAGPANAPDTGTANTKPAPQNDNFGSVPHRGEIA